MTIHLTTFGGVRALRDDAELDWLLDQRLRTALFVYLAVERRASRESVTAVFWPESGDENARHALRQSLYLIRKSLGEEWLESRAHELRVSAHVHADATTFTAALERGDVEAACRLYGGPFLEGVNLVDLKAWENWVDGRRTQYARGFRKACREWLESRRSAGDLTAAVDVAQRWVSTDPSDDEAQHRLIEVLADAGERAEAIRQFETYVRLLEPDGLRPLDETVELIERVRTEAAAWPAGDSARAPVAAGLDGTAGAPAPASSDARAAGDEEPRPDLGGARSARQLWHRLRVPAIAVVLVTAFFAWRAFTSAPPVPTRLAVLPLENRTADPALEEWGEYAADMLTRRIDLAARVDVIPASTVRDAIRALGAPPAPSAAAIAMRTGASHILTGSMASVGGSIRIDVEIVDARSVKRLLSPDPISGPADSLEVVIDRLAERTAAASLALFEPRPGWMGGYTLPTTIGMYRDYNATFQLFCQSRYSEVITTGNRVLEKSPDFIPVMGLVRFAYWNVGRTTEADSVHVRLEQLRDRMTASERVEHDWMGGLIDGDTSLTARSAEEMFQIDPSSKYGFAAGFTAFRMRRLEDALQRFLAADLDLPCQSAWFPWWNYTAAAYHLLDRFEDEIRLAQRASARFPDRSQLYDMELRAAAATSRSGVLDSILARVADLPPPPPGGLAFGRVATNAALELRAHGQGEHADRLIQRALEWFAGRSPSEYRFDRGLAFIAAGLWADADTLFSGVVRDAPATDNSTYIGYLGYRGVALANLGRRDDALEWSRRLERIPGRPVLTSYGTAARAAIAAALGDRDGAIRLLNDAFQHGYPYDIFMHQSPWWDPLRNRRDFEAMVRPK